MSQGLLPERASTAAAETDGLFLLLTLVSCVYAALIFGLLLAFALRYRRRSEGERAGRSEVGLGLELAWTLVPLGTGLGIFAWGTGAYLRQVEAPEGAIPIAVVGKQWMWKVQHADGRREVNELHVPAGRPVVLRIGSEDVIHSFYVPAFRLKMDAVPGRTSSLWFQATTPGSYRIFCAEYCGTQHSGMIGRLVVLEPSRFERWLAGGESGGEGLPTAGERLFLRLGCASCHHAESGPRGPDLAGVFGRPTRFRDGGEAAADEAYLRESILDPQARIVAGYEPLMPTYRGQLPEEGMLQLVEYLRALRGPGARR